MEAHNNLRLLFLSFSLLLSAHFARSDLSPSPSPGPEPDHSISPSPGPNPDFSSGPAPVPSPSGGSLSGPSPSPTSEASEGPDQFDFSDTLSPESDINPLVKQICDSTDHPALCLATIVPRLDGNSDAPAVAEIAIRTTADLAKIGLTLAKRLANNPMIPPELASILKDCMTASTPRLKTLTARSMRSLAEMLAP
ncbi:hypothetical protein CASFOL_004978 [Castilleja foliolosa]|uniref:Pectinesterase inhibitor domain-containing protein n=1 Tax=Castilleja foliolosa TaxID=1961234 RepID=A0ABD3E244_9LAMI